MTDNRKPYIIGITGPSGSGKTCIAQKVAEALGGTVFSLDSYYRDLSHLPLEERRKTNFDHPDSLDSELLSRDLRTLAVKKPIDRPVYDFATHCRTQNTERIMPGAYLIVEGIFTLNYPAVRDIFDLKVFVEAGHDVCFERRLKRDLAERGYTEDYIRKLYDEAVRPMTDQFLNPTRVYADVVVDGTRPVEESVAKILERVRQHKDMKKASKEIIESTLNCLVGEKLWACGRACDLATFNFGERKLVKGWRGIEKEVGTYALHVECAWNLTQNGCVIIGSRDRFYLPDLAQLDMPEDFEWDKGPNRRDILIKKLFDDGTKQYAVLTVTSQGAGHLEIQLEQDLVLTIIPDFSIDDRECWRFFKPYVEEEHFVVLPRGIEE